MPRSIDGGLALTCAGYSTRPFARSVAVSRDVQRMVIVESSVYPRVAGSRLNSGASQSIENATEKRPGSTFEAVTSDRTGPAASMVTP